MANLNIKNILEIIARKNDCRSIAHLCEALDDSSVSNEKAMCSIFQNVEKYTAENLNLMIGDETVFGAFSEDDYRKQNEASSAMFRSVDYLAFVLDVDASAYRTTVLDTL